MKHERIMLQRGNRKAWIDTYIANKIEGFTRDAILVIPGGAYRACCTGKEGEPIAQAFIPFGFNAFVLHYSVASDGVRFPQQLIEVSLAVKHIKDNAESYGINSDRVFVLGFSAGGHLATALGTLWHLDSIYDAIPDMSFGYNKPIGIIPLYPVVSSDPEISHKDSFDNICGINSTEEQRRKYSLEYCVDACSAPAFIVHTANDEAVNVRNSIRLANAYAEHSVQFELHIFEEGPHGMALCNEITSYGSSKLVNPHNAKWVELAAEWAKMLK